MLIESLLLAVIGSVVGLLARRRRARALVALSPGNLPRIEELAQSSLTGALLDWRLLAFTLTLSIVTGVLFGMRPRCTWRELILARA